MKYLKLKQWIYIVLDVICYFLIIFNIFTSKFNVTIDSSIRYSATFIYCLFSILICVLNNHKSLSLMLSSVFVFIADFFLLFETENTMYGIVLFALAQVCYQFYISDAKELSLKHIVISVCIGLVLALVGLIFKSSGDRIIYAASIYFAISLYNLISVIIKLTKAKDKTIYLYATLSIFMLICCDICIGLYEVTDKMIFNNLEWVFYVPSLTLMFIQQIKNTTLLSKEVNV